MINVSQAAPRTDGCKIEDIIDSIYGGESHDHGLMYLKDNNRLHSISLTGGEPMINPDIVNDYMENITIIGSGSWGVALGVYLASLGHTIKMWSFAQEENDEINNMLKQTITLLEKELKKILNVKVLMSF